MKSPCGPASVLPLKSFPEKRVSARPVVIEKEKRGFLVFVFDGDPEIRGSFRETPYPPPRHQNQVQLFPDGYHGNKDAWARVRDR